MLPCVIDQRPIPLDIIRSAIRRASNPVGMDSWEWEKLSITCALVNKEEGYSVALNLETTDRSYVFGRMLAIADVLERSALGKEEKRATNAIRYMNAFAQRPGRTWSIIQSTFSLIRHEWELMQDIIIRYWMKSVISFNWKIIQINHSRVCIYLILQPAQRLVHEQKDKDAVTAALEDHDENQSTEQGDN